MSGHPVGVANRSFQHSANQPDSVEQPESTTDSCTTGSNNGAPAQPIVARLDRFNGVAIRVLPAEAASNLDLLFRPADRTAPPGLSQRQRDGAATGLLEVLEANLVVLPAPTWWPVHDSRPATSATTQSGQGALDSSRSTSNPTAHSRGLASAAAGLTLAAMVAIGILGLRQGATNQPSDASTPIVSSSLDPEGSGADAPLLSSSTEAGSTSAPLPELGKQNPTVTVAGDRLPPNDISLLPDPESNLSPNADKSIGALIPRLTGTSVIGEPLTIQPGVPMTVAVVAHWSPESQQLIAQLTELAQVGGVPPQVAVYAISAAERPGGNNYPTSAWFAQEGFPFPVLVDDPQRSATIALSIDRFPTLFAVREDGTVAAVHRGATSLADVLTSFANALN